MVLLDVALVGLLVVCELVGLAVAVGLLGALLGLLVVDLGCMVGGEVRSSLGFDALAPEVSGLP